MPKRAETTGAEKPAVKRTVTRRRKTVVPVEPTWEAVATRAYFLSLETDADPLENWLRAERELVAA